MSHSKPSPLPTTSPLYSIGRFVLLALADDHGSGHVHRTEHVSHGVDGGPVGADLVASAHPSGRGQGGGLGDPHEFEREVAIRVLLGVHDPTIPRRRGPVRIAAAGWHDVAVADDQTVPDADVDHDDGADDPAPMGEHDSLAYDLSELSEESREHLEALLVANDVSRVWQGATVSVSGLDEELVERLLDEVIVAQRPTLESDRERVVYEVGEWPTSYENALAEALGVAQIPFEWNIDGDLVVYADDEDRVEEILDTLPDPDDPDRDEADALDANSVMTALFLAVKTLADDPRNAHAVLAVSAAAADMERLSLPFGLEAPMWRRMVRRAGELRDALDAEDGPESWSDADVEDAAAQLRDQLARLV